MTDQELIQQLQAAISLLNSVCQEIHLRAKLPAQHEGKLSKSPSAKNDPIEFYVSHCTFKESNEITGSELFATYKEWCRGNGSLTRGRRPFLDAVAQLGAPDGITGVTREKSYTFRNLALKTS